MGEKISMISGIAFKTMMFFGWLFSVSGITLLVVSFKHQKIITATIKITIFSGWAFLVSVVTLLISMCVGL